jgi:hypothetical protein
MHTSCKDIGVPWQQKWNASNATTALSSRRQTNHGLVEPQHGRGVADNILKLVLFP